MPFFILIGGIEDVYDFMFYLRLEFEISSAKCRGQ